MGEEGLAVGRDALARAMDLARKSSRAARVMALVVPLAVVAAQHQAHAITENLPTGGSQGFSISSGAGGYSQSGTVTWGVTHNSGLWQYSIDFNVTSGDFTIDGIPQGASGLTEVDIPYDLNNVEDLEVNGFGTGGGGDATLSYADGISHLVGFGFLNPFDITFISDAGPVLATYDIDGSGGGSGSVGPPIAVDPPVPGAVPEPGTLSLFGMALLGFGALRRRLTG